MGDYKVVKVLHDASVEYSPAERNLDYVKNIVYQRENPNPFLTAGLVLLVFLIIYVVYVLFVKRKISGDWFGNIGDMPVAVKYHITHNPFTDSLSIKWDGGKSNGRLIGRTIVLYDGQKETVGVLVGRHKIVWVNSNDVWNHVKVLN